MKTLWHEEPSSPERAVNMGPGMCAPCWPKRSLPSFESEHGLILVLDVWIAQLDASGLLRFFPRLYGFATSRAQEEALCPLHDDPSAMWTWRPLIYRLTMDRAVLRLGSQQELEYRSGLLEVFRAGLFDDPEILMEWAEARVRAHEILLEHLNPQQRIDYWALDKFYVRGHINTLYEIEIGNGFAIVSPETREIRVKYCCHPEYWMPHEDVSLATKLAIESDEESERELLEAGKPTLMKKQWETLPEERYAWKLEKELLA